MRYKVTVEYKVAVTFVFLLIFFIDYSEAAGWCYLHLQVIRHIIN